MSDQDKKPQSYSYAQAGVKEFWLVLVPERRVEVHRVPAGDRFVETTVVNLGDELASGALPEVRLDLCEIFER